MNKLLKLAVVALVAAPLFANAEEAKAAAPAVKFSGLVDSFYTVYPTTSQSYVSPTLGYSQPSGFNFNYAKLGAALDTEKAGFKLDLVYGTQGRAITTSDITDPDPLAQTRLFVRQAYGTYKLGAFTLDAGRMDTPAGFEVFDAKDNWLYTKGLLYTFLVPTSHEGIRVAYSGLAEGLTVTGYLVNGSDLWTVETGLTGSPTKTGILNLVYSKGALAAAGSVLYSQIPGGKDTVFQVDANVTYTAGALAVNVAGDYISYDFDGGPSATLSGAALSAKYDLGVARVVGRVEYLNDDKGVRFTAADASSALAKTATSYTVGAQLPFGDNAELRAEARLDAAGKDIYGPAGDKGNITSITVAALAWF